MLEDAETEKQEQKTYFYAKGIEDTFSFKITITVVSVPKHS